MNGIPLVTFGIPAYNRPALLAEALASIAAQTERIEYEVIVTDDGDQPETAAVVARFPANRFRYHRNTPPLGAVQNWNEGLRRARGRWVMILHEDDTLYPWYVAQVLPLLRDGLAAVCTKTIAGATMPHLPAPTSRSKACPYPASWFLKSSMTPFPGVLFARELALRLGGFDARMGPLADYDFWYRMARAARIEVMPVVGAFYRIAEGQWTERAWPEMLRKTHLLRLRIAREQIASRDSGRWLARFFTGRNARAYAKRFKERPAALRRALRFTEISLGWLPSGWVWQAFKLFAK